jgi:hypothetical protein
VSKSKIKIFLISKKENEFSANIKATLILGCLSASKSTRPRGADMVISSASVWVLDQWPAHAPNPAHPPQPREVLNDNSRGISNNSNSYHVILVAPEE